MTTDHAIDQRSQRNGLALLSPREHEVLGLVALGHSNAEVAAELVISVATVKSHVAQLLRKLRARDRVALVVLAWQTELVGSAPRPAPHVAHRPRAVRRQCRVVRMAG